VPHVAGVPHVSEPDGVDVVAIATAIPDPVRELEAASVDLVKTDPDPARELEATSVGLVETDPDPPEDAVPVIVGNADRPDTL
jgi:hypothetical protein